MPSRKRCPRLRDRSQRSQGSSQPHGQGALQRTKAPPRGARGQWWGRQPTPLIPTQVRGASFSADHWHKPWEPGTKTHPAASRTPRSSAEHDANPTGGAEQHMQTQPSRDSTTLETTLPSGHAEGPARGERSGIGLTNETGGPQTIQCRPLSKMLRGSNSKTRLLCGRPEGPAQSTLAYPTGSAEQQMQTQPSRAGAPPWK